MKYLNIRLLNNNEIYFSNSLNYDIDDKVVLNTELGEMLGIVLSERLIDSKNIKLYDIIRKADQQDLDNYNNNLLDKEKAKKTVINIIKGEGLEMKVIDLFFNLDRTTLVVYFSAPSRVDFRELIKKLASKFKARIELRQVGVRDKAKKIGGIGICGQPLCCTRFLDQFESISINMAKNQNIALAPENINGVCGRLMCCLSFENDTYTLLNEELQRNRKKIEEKGKIKSVDILNKTFTVINKNNQTEVISLED